MEREKQTLQRYISVSVFLCIERSKEINEVRLPAKVYVFCPLQLRAEDSDTGATQVGGRVAVLAETEMKGEPVGLF